MKLAIIVAVLVGLCVVGLMLRRRRGYRGAIGFKNRQPTEIATIRLAGFSRPVECGSLTQGEHSFNYLGRQDIPAEVQIRWRLVGDDSDRAATVSLSGVPKDVSDGELFFVLSSLDTWTVEYAPQLQLDKLQQGG